MNRSVAILMRGGVAVIDAEADIRRSAGEVFDYASDPANEPEWNIRMKRIEKLTGGPVGVGARYRMEFTQGPPAVSECVRFERPAFWELAGGSKIISSGFSGRVVSRGDGSHLLLRMQIRLRGPLRWALPLVRRRMRRELARDVATIKERLEGAAPASAGHRPAKRVREDQRRRVVAEFLARKRTTGTRPLAGRRVMKQQRVSEAALSRRLGGSGEPVPGGHAAGVEPDQRGPGREARDTFRHDPVRGDGPGGPPAGESWRAGVSRRWRGWLVGEVAGARLPGHRAVSVRVLRLVAAAGCYPGRPGGRLPRAAGPSWDRPRDRARVLRGQRLGAGVRVAPPGPAHRAGPGELPPGRRGHREQEIRPGVPSRLQRGPAVLDLQAADAHGLLPDDGRPPGDTGRPRKRRR